jgi:hypothetical protein
VGDSLSEPFEVVVGPFSHQLDPSIGQVAYESGYGKP